MIRIPVADDHPMMRKGLKQLFSETDDMMVTGEASDGGEVFEMVSKGNYDLLQLDISMPGTTRVIAFIGEHPLQ